MYLILILGGLSTIVLIGLATYKIYELRSLSKTTKEIGKRIKNFETRDRRALTKEINKLRQDYTDWNLLMIANSYSWSSFTISCLPSLYFRKKNKIHFAFVWSEVLKLIPPSFNYSVINKYCLDQVIKISMPEETYQIVNEIALNLENARLHNPYPSYSSLMGAINQYINNYELEAKETNRSDLAEFLKAERKELLQEELKLVLTTA